MPHHHPVPDGLLLDETRRHLFARCGVGVGAMALGAFLPARHAVRLRQATDCRECLAFLACRTFFPRRSG